MPTISKKSESVVATKNNLLTTDVIAYIVLFVGLLALPVFFIPGLGVSVILAKKFFLLSLVVIVFILWIVSRVQVGVVKMPWNLSTVAVLSLPAAFLISAILNGTFWYSFFGNLYQSGTVVGIGSLALLFLLTLVLFDKTSKILNFFLAFSVVGAGVGGYHLLRFLSGPWLPAQLGEILPASIIGAWYETGVFFGLTTLVSLVLLEFIPLVKARGLKIGITLSLGLSILSLALINFYPIWIILGLVAVVIFTYKMVTENKTLDSATDEVRGSNKLLKPSFVVLLVALLFFSLGRPGGLISTKLESLYQYFQFSYVEVRPGLSSTIEVGKEVFKESPLVGAGPNNFQNAWVKHRPKFINELAYWNVDFNSAFGVIPTYIINTGLLGLLAFLFFFFAIIKESFTQSRRKLKEGDYINKVVLGLSALVTLYLWGVLIFYTPNAFGLPFAFLGAAFLVASVSVGRDKNKIIYFNKDPKVHFVAILILVLFLIGSITVGYGLIQRFWSVITYEKAVASLSVGDVAGAEKEIVKAINLDDGSAIYYRILSEIKVRQINSILNSTDLSEEEIRPLLIDYINQAVASAKKAVELNDKNYLNLVTLANIYEFLDTLGIENSYEEAKNVYNEARKLNPNNPDILLGLSRLEINQKNFDGARDILEEALAIKSNYASSLLFIAQVNLQTSGAEKAIASLEEAVGRVPSDSNLWFQLGLLRYQTDKTEEAISALKRSIELSQGGINANASYFLGLAYDKTGETSLALEQFNLIAEFNPDNKEVKTIIANLRAGRAALFGLVVNQAPSLTEDEDVLGEDEEVGVEDESNNEDEETLE